ncbi:MAG: hypothetical protein RIS36_1517 [Pseudomonadota bacterium]|jgi:hypothetical protein
MKRTLYLASAFAALLGSTPYAMAADVRVIHGINGKDLGLAQELPVDISVNGACALKGVKFKQSTKVELGGGDYTVRVFVATGSCAGTPVIEKSVTIPAEAEAAAFSLVASLSSNGTPQLAVFQNTGTTIITTGVGVRHLAKAGVVKVRVALRERGVRLPSSTATIRNGQETTQGVLGADSLRYTISLEPRSAKRVTLPSQDVRRSYRILYVVGSLQNGFSVISETIKIPRK